MAGKSKTKSGSSKGELNVMSVKVPKFEDYYRSASEFDPNSRDSFEPFRFTILRQGKSGVTLEHRSRGDHNMPNPIPVVLIYTNSILECKCTEKGNPQNLICFSPNRKYSTSGMSCKECPYKAKLPGKDRLVAKPEYQIRSLKNFFLMPLIDDELVLARFKSTFKNISNLAELAENVRAKVSHLGINEVMQVVINLHITKVNENNYTVYRPDPENVDIIGVLDEGSWDGMKSFLRNLIDYDKKRMEKSAEYVFSKYKSVQEELSVSTPPSAPPAPERTTTTAPDPGESEGDEPVADPPDDDDDDLPF